jgi:hypothetical protein
VSSELLGLYRSPRRLWWFGHVARMMILKVYTDLVGNLLESSHFEEQEGDGRVALRQMLGKYVDCWEGRWIILRHNHI